MATSGEGIGGRQARQQIDDRQTEPDEPIGRRRHMDELRHLRQEDEDRQCVDKAGHHRLRDEPHQAVELAAGRPRIWNRPIRMVAANRILHAMIVDEPGHQYGGGGGRGRDHGRPAAGEGDDAGDHHRGVEADLRIDTGDDRKADGLRDERERHDEAGQDLDTRVSDPVTWIEQHVHDRLEV